MLLRRHIEHGVVRGKVSIQQAEFRDDTTAYVGQKRKPDPLGGREFAEYLRRIVADPDQPDVPALQLALDLLQLN